VTEANKPGEARLAETAFIALYRGRTVGDARLIAVSSDHSIVERFFRELVSEDTVIEKCPKTYRSDTSMVSVLAKHEE
jgi:choline kinase